MDTVFYPPHPGIKAGNPNTGASPTWFYFIDPSCDDASNGDFEACLFEARHWAKRAYERLTSETDTDFARVFHILFKVPITDTSPHPMSPLWESVHGPHPKGQWRTSTEHVLGVLHNFAHCWKRTYDRKEADVRMYATDLAHTRWLSYEPNLSVDLVNGIYTTEPLEELLEPDTAATLCDGMFFPGEGENPRRCVIELSPDLWMAAKGQGPEATGFLTLREMDPSVLLGHKTEVDEVHVARLLTKWKLAEDLIPCVLFHEFMHVYLLDDFADDDKSSTAGWRHCMLRKRGEAPVCAESLAMLGLCAALADIKPANKPSGGFSLHRWWREAPGTLYDEDGRATADDDTICEPNQEYVMSAVRGQLIFYENLTS